ncbi:carboxy terminal-processing peptidase [Chryseolinea sp. T2]|uniref:carboxy terminal-processing peptidase n=1 Tax=Chryseolinea sp. T2 TaxID=3129255 RepID=UPI003077440D
MRRLFVAGFLSISLISISALANVVPADTTRLKAKPIYGREAKVIAYILDNNHYRKVHFNDSLSSAVLDEYIKSLDNNKTYFLASDRAAFDKYRSTLDDLTRAENVDAAFEIYAVFRKRFDQRMDYILNNLVKKTFDYSVDEYYETDRDKEPWCKDEAALNEVWRKIIKSQALSLKLAGKNQADIEKSLTDRYQRFSKSIHQFNSEDVFSMYMNTITESYDPHTNYMSPKSADVFKQQMSLSLEGIGARLQTDNDYTKVSEIITGGPADKSKLVGVNDRIIGVAQGADGEMVDVIGWRIDDVVKLIKGPKGTTVKLQILPAETGVTGASKVISLVRDKIKLEDQQAKKSVINYEKNGKLLKLGVITLPSFYMDFDAYQKGDPNYTSTTRDVQRLISELQAEKIDGLAIDLRNNGGGALAEAIELTGLFIKDGPVVQVKNSANKIEVGKDDDPSVAYNGPLVVLTNRFSASASEIFAGAIQDYHRGVIIGESTYGKGTVQTVVDLKRFINAPDDEVGELKITFQKFYRVTGSSTQHKGVTPDINLPTALNPEQFGESSSQSALPWDEIKGTLYQKTPMVNDRTLANLNKLYQQRLQDDAQLKRFVTETAETKKSYQETKISLNEGTRKKEIEEAEKRKAANDKLDTKIVRKESGEPTDLLDVDDEYLREGLFVLGDMLATKLG